MGIGVYPNLNTEVDRCTNVDDAFPGPESLLRLAGCVP